MTLLYETDIVNYICVYTTFSKNITQMLILIRTVEASPKKYYERVRKILF